MTCNLPKVAIMHGEGSASPLTIKAASLGLCQLVFLYADCNKKDQTQLELLKKHVGVFDISSLTDLEVATLLREEQVSGIVTFSEYKLPEVTKYCTILGLNGHSAEILACLTDKYLQRERLAASNISAVRHAIVDRHDVEGAAELVGFPAILKPRIGAGSRWTVKVSYIEQLRHELSLGPSDCEYVLEEFLAGDEALHDQFYGDYVSVESIHSNGKSQQVCVTAKLPLTEHFAETGMFVPHPFSSKLAEQILDLESKAIQAIGVTDGVTHTEIKLTSSGPKIIEINGRVGGYVPEILKRAMGVDLVRAALQVSLGEEAIIIVKPITSVVYQVFLDAPIVEPSSFVGMNGMEEVERMDGVLHLEITKDVGQIINYRLGTQSNLGIVYGTAPDFESFSKNTQDIKSTLVPNLSVQRGG
ncbi:ATP-grasp domain-containing protein [Paenibacillus wynnii]|uniref:ATP-grasp domain-containing protein n=1 Tax=Paenibacillus wynnii TaxID=268407 RepID=UPI00278D51FE|nr:ATP-grasp domain-containing protein [Paenibacillus wynnii]MDQ0195346.1 biotin carboxylase [Paenibacillus wynnii]